MKPIKMTRFMSSVGYGLLYGEDFDAMGLINDHTHGPVTVFEGSRERAERLYAMLHDDNIGEVEVTI